MLIGLDFIIFSIEDGLFYKNPLCTEDQIIVLSKIRYAQPSAVLLAWGGAQKAWYWPRDGVQIAWCWPGGGAQKAWCWPAGLGVELSDWMLA